MFDMCFHVGSRLDTTDVINRHVQRENRFPSVGTGVKLAQNKRNKRQNTKQLQTRPNQTMPSGTCRRPEIRVIRGTPRIVSVNYLFGRPLIPYNFLKIIFASNFRDIGNLRRGVFGLLKMPFRVPKKGQLRFSERK